MRKQSNYCVIAYTLYKADNRVRRYAETLAKKGSRVDVIAAKQSKNEKSHEVLNGVDIHRVSIKGNSKSKFIGFCYGILLFFIAGSFALLFKHIKHRYSVIHINNMPDLLVFMGIIPKLLGAKLILDIHDIVPEYYCQKYTKSMRSTVARTFLFLEKASVKQADHVIVANDIWRNKIIARDGVAENRCTALLNYPELRYFVPHQGFGSNGTLRVIYPGTISHLHGSDIAIRAIAIVKNKIPKVKLDIYTSRRGISFQKYIEELIEFLDLSENVEFFDVVPMEKLSHILSKSHIGIVPKRGGIFASEAFSTKTLDFMAAGLPVIASETTIDRYYFDDSLMMFFKPESSEELAQCILELALNKDKAMSLATNGLKFIDANNWDIKKCIYTELIDKLAGSVPQTSVIDSGKQADEKM